jgi:hypothetical protein
VAITARGPRAQPLAGSPIARGCSRRAAAAGRLRELDLVQHGDVDAFQQRAGWA